MYIKGYKYNNGYDYNGSKKTNRVRWTDVVMFSAIIILLLSTLMACGSSRGRSSVSKNTFLEPTIKQDVFFDPYEGVCYVCFSEDANSGYAGYGYLTEYICGDNDQPYHYDPRTQTFFTLPESKEEITNGEL